MNYRLKLFFLVLLGPALGVQAESLRLSLDDSVQAALNYSQALKAAQYQVEAAKAHESATSDALLPRLDIDGRYAYSAEVLPSIHLPPPGFGGLTTIDFGFHNAYSIGLAANWDIIGGITTWRQSQVAVEQRRAMEAQLADQRQALRLRVRLAYFQTQLAETQVRLYTEALKLAQSQCHDLDLRLKAGTSSKIDWYTASNDELDRRGSYRLAQVALAGALRDLFAMTGEHRDEDVSVPSDDAASQTLPANVEHPTLSVNLDDTSSLFSELAPAASAHFQPQDVAKLRVLQAQVAFYQRQVDVAFAGHLPTGSVGFRWSEDYPQAPVNQAVDQQTTSANFTLPLFSFGQVQKNVEQQQNLAQSAEESVEDAITLTQTDWEKSHDRLSGLRTQRDLQVQEARQTTDLQDMVYKSYKIGGSTFLEVQSTSLQSLQAGLSLAQTETQMLIELANLSALTEGDR